MLEDILVLIVINIFAILSPGPDMVLLLKNGLSHGKSVGMATVAGICSGLLFHVGLAILGLTILLTQNQWLYQGVKFLGAGYLMYIGIEALKSQSSTNLSVETDLSHKSLLKGFQDGLFCNVLNPKVTLFVFSIFTQFVEEGASVATKLIYGSVVVGAAIVVWSIFMFLIQSSVVKGYLEKSERIISIVFGFLMIGIGLSVALSKSGFLDVSSELAIV